MKKSLLTLCLVIAALSGFAWLALYRHSALAPGRSAPATAGTARQTQVSAGEQDLAALKAKAARAPRILPVFGLNGESLAVRQKALDALAPPYTPEEIAAAIAFLHSTGERPGVPRGVEHVLKNGLMDLLTRQGAPPTNLLQELCALYNDRQQDSVTRDYAVQYVIANGLRETARSAADRPVVREALWEALNETDSSISGTALLGLHRLAAIDPAVETNRLDQAALRLTSEPGVGNLARTTALQVCAQRRLTVALPSAAELAKNGDNITVQAAAIAALADLGAEPELELLQALRKQDQPALRMAINSALRRLEKRLAPRNGQASPR
ncbi:MAG: hypothetical protein WCQ21_02930 [Verrucomicrobiota bacterium]